MVTRIILTTFIIALCNSSSADNEPFLCQGDHEVRDKANICDIGKTAIVLIENRLNNPFVKSNTSNGELVTHVKGNCRNVIIVYADRCPITTNILFKNKPTNERYFPAFFMMKSKSMVDEDPVYFTDKNLTEVKELIIKVDKMTVPERAYNYLYELLNKILSRTPYLEQGSSSTTIGTKRNREESESSGTQWVPQMQNSVTMGTTAPRGRSWLDINQVPQEQQFYQPAQHPPVPQAWSVMGLSFGPQITQPAISVRPQNRQRIYRPEPQRRPIELRNVGNQNNRGGSRLTPSQNMGSNSAFNPYHRRSNPPN